METGSEIPQKKTTTSQVSTEPEDKEQSLELFTAEKIEQKKDEIIAATEKVDPPKLIPFKRGEKNIFRKSQPTDRKESIKNFR